ncbi:ADP-ribosylation factor GTPase-activating protein AGD4 [Canna indica]|uniref:ADP-ribosylation factor GTPase-activating protein AGD4 n=1 Tax=Canna indica TaxID=4628 RepID=A0AAQ3KCN1_9LILI|nr:ADP-ribosylation factor GTPase-activating protein AGD4 [Canna indica]
MVYKDDLKRGHTYNGDLSFAQSLEAFGAGKDDPVSVAIGGPVMSKFTTAFRELGGYKELLRSQVEHMLSNLPMQLINMDMQNVERTAGTGGKYNSHQYPEATITVPKWVRINWEIEPVYNHPINGLDY